MAIIFGDCKRLLDLRMFLENGIDLVQGPRENGCCSSSLNQDVAITGLACYYYNMLEKHLADSAGVDPAGLCC